MLGAICGDYIGSRFEGIHNNNVNQKSFRLFTNKSRFTDDTVLTVAVAKSLLTDGDYAKHYRSYYQAFPHAGFGSGFKRWANSNDNNAYFSLGNGSAMRVSPVAYISDDLDCVLQEAERSAKVTHNHPQGIMGAKAVACSVFMARKGVAKSDIADEIRTRFNYNLSGKYNATHLGFDVTCGGSVPHAIHAFLIGSNFEDVIRRSVLMGGDTDTIASIAGAISEAYWGIPQSIESKVYSVLNASLSCTVAEFVKRYVKKDIDKLIC